MALFNNSSRTNPPPTPEQKQQLQEYLLQRQELRGAEANPMLAERLSNQSKSNQFVVNPLDEQLSMIAENPNRSVNINDAMNFSRTVPSVENKNVPTPSPSMNPVVKDYLQKKMNPKSESVEPMKPTETKKDDGSGIDWTYAFQGLGAIGDSIRAGSGGGSNQMGNAQAFQGMRDSRDQKIEIAKMNDPQNEKAVEFRDFLKNNFNPKLLKNVDLDKLSLGDMQGMYGQIKDREQADMQKQMMYAKAGAKGSVKNNPNAIKDVNEHMASLRDLASQRTNISELNRKPGGSFFPDFDSKTISKASEVDKLAQSGVKAIAGPGTISDSERKSFLPLLPNSQERSGVALAKSKESMRTAIDKGRKYINDQYMTGGIDEDTAKYYLNQYAQEEVNAGLYEPDKKGKK